MEIIYFNQKDFIELSNYYGARPNEHLVLFIDGKTWPTVEHYIQAQKYQSCPEFIEIIRAADSPLKARALGQKHKMSHNVCLSKTDNRKINDLIDIHQDVKIVRNWQFIKDEILLKAIRVKVAQNQHIFDLLSSTKGYILYHVGHRQNKLGKIYMRVRAELPP